ncbi:RES family NAD+ phosphorylase [Lysinibacter cavernae]|uniref:RES domain-containing protein n=1 Tax=Lysinibacter cavernae TaxID=1640652 RepID=A0A7X5R048_9MICO|nr:RES family NAD+ phosphorylase [Lysinibacter cavernae]NIH53141.1 hypothetical protein [Lysinibacter cavernae]
MQLYRVVPYLPNAKIGEPGHPTYLHHPQGAGRWDNPTLYDTWYLSTTPDGAIGEIFGDLPQWSEGMFEFPPLPGARRALATFSLPDATRILDLDDASQLAKRNIRPSQLVARNRGYTHGVAERIVAEREADGTTAWTGVSWWSIQSPLWTNIAIFVPRSERSPLSLSGVEPLDLATSAVREAARTLVRPVRP